MKQRCKVCGKVKKLELFFKDKRVKLGVTSKCLSCHNEYIKKWYKENPEKALKIIARRRFLLRTTGLGKIISKNYYRDNTEKMKEHVYKGIRNNREKNRARQMVHKALKRGALIRPETCQDCKKVTKVQAHHPDYSRPLYVKWLCHRCHVLEHCSKEYRKMFKKLEKANNKLLTNK